MSAYVKNRIFTKNVSNFEILRQIVLYLRPASLKSVVTVELAVQI